MSPSHYTTPPSHPPPNDTSLSALLASQHHMNGHPQPMDARQQEYSQPGLTQSYASFHDHSSEEASADPASAAQYQPDVKFGPQDVRSNFSPNSSTPNSDYALAPQSARSGSFPDYIQQQQQQQQQPRSYQEGAPRYQQAQPHPGHAAMAQTSPSMSLPDGSPIGDATRNQSSNPHLPIDPSIAQATSSPQYAPQHQQQYSPYPPQHEMYAHPGQPGAPMYAPRPEWAGHYAAPMYHAQVSAAGGAPGMIAQVPRPPGVRSPGDASSSPHAATVAYNYFQGGHPLSTVYSFVPIPGAQQHKRPRRRYEEIERMYKCGWQGCEKAYGTLNHLNAHVTMQSHGQKRTPEGMKAPRLSNIFLIPPNATIDVLLCGSK